MFTALVRHFCASVRRRLRKSPKPRAVILWERWRPRNPRRSHGKVAWRWVRSWRQGVAILSLAASLPLGLAVGVGVYVSLKRLMHLPYFQIKQVQMIGLERISAAELGEFVGVAEGDPIFNWRVEDLAARCLAHPWIRQAAVVRRLPDVLVFTLEEHKPALLVALSAVYVADHEGHLFKILEEQDHLDLPVLTGFGWDQEIAMTSDINQRVQTAIALYHLYETSYGDVGQVEEMHVDPALGYSILLRGSHSRGEHVQVNLGIQPFESLPNAVAALRILQNYPTPPHLVWADLQSPPVRIAVEMAH